MKNKYQHIERVRKYLKIYEYKRNKPHASLEEVGKLFNIKKQRVDQILKYLKRKGIDWELGLQEEQVNNLQEEFKDLPVDKLLLTSLVDESKIK